MLSRTPDRRPPRVLNPYIQCAGVNQYLRWSNDAADPDVTSGERTYRQGSVRPCAGFDGRARRTGVRRILALPERAL